VQRVSRPALACLTVLATAVMLLRLPSVWGTIQDDGFIYFRIAGHAAHGLGPVFNAGERVDAATSPVWVWLLAAANRLGMPLPLAAVLLGLLAWLGTVLLAAQWALELASTARRGSTLDLGDAQTAPPGSSPRAGLALVLALAMPAILVVDIRHVFYAVSGMETTVAALAWLAATRALVRRWLQGLAAPRAGLVALLACLVRPEFVLFIAALAVVALWRRSASRSEIWRTLLPVAIGGAAYLSAHWAYFGDPFPNTWRAKRADDWNHTRIGLAYLAGLPRSHPWLLLGFAAALVPALRRIAAGVAVGCLLYALHLATLGGDHFMFYRPFVIVAPMLLALAGGAAAQLASGSAMQAGGRRALVRAMLVAASVTALVGAGVQRIPPAPFAWVRNAAQLGYTLARTYPPTTRVGLFAIGAAGYTSHLPVVDALGLADRHVAGCDLSHEHVCALDIGHERGDPEYVLAHADVVVPFGAYAPVRFENLAEVREGFYSQKKFLAAARQAVADGRFRLRNLEFAPGAYWLVLEKVR
jgi:arabinofuranosyltransferase